MCTSPSSEDAMDVAGNTFKSPWGRVDVEGTRVKCLEVRLYGPDFLLQSFSNRDQKWKPVCSHMWDDTIGRKICSEIGYGRKDYVGFGQMSPGGGSSDGYMILKSDSSIRTLLTDRMPLFKMWTVYAGYLTLKEMESGSGSAVSRIFSHPGYEPMTKDKDIALMKLERPLSLSGLVSDTLREARVSLISSSVCNSSAFYNGQITDTMICAGRREGGVDTCQGDSGGPLVTQANQLWWLVGDTSWGIGCGVKNKPGVYGNVTYFLEWIYEKMQ
ncbi:hypothetical protein NFI96_005500, partial [Prochilodus magdalenae]